MTHGHGPGFGRDAELNRENKLALIIGFTLILVVGVLVSDHLSRANSAALVVEDGQGDTLIHQPISGGTIRDTIAANIAPRTAAQNAQAVETPPARRQPGSLGGSMALTDPNPEVIDQGSGPDAIGRLATTAGNTFNKILDIYSNSAVPAVEIDRAGPRGVITEPTSTIPTTIPYEVKAGDNIYRIAQRYLGDGERWREIRDQNRATVGDDGQLAVGARLKIRVLEPAAQPGSAAFARETPRLPISDTPRPIDIGDGAFRTYEVRAGDILGKIAQKQLGTVKRMDEILRLNADKLADADSIRVGMKIKLPSK